MLFVEGSRVKLKHTGDEGIIEELLDGDMATVLLDDDEGAIPVSLEDLIRIDKNAPSTSTVKAKSVPGKQAKVKQPDYPKIVSQYAILKSLGIQVAFDPIETLSGLTTSYDIYLVNDTRYGVIYNFSLSIKDDSKINISNKLESLSAQKLGSLAFDQLSDNPQIDMKVWQLTTAGQGEELNKSFKIKPKQFFNKSLTAPILNRPVFLYRVFESFDTPEDKKDQEDLRTYTQRNQVETPDHDYYYSTVDQYSVEAFAHFANELDLHIEKLTNSTKKIDNASILRIQLEAFEDFMEEAIRLGVKQLFVIHGVGKGKLKDEIAKKLSGYSEVQSFKNEFHPRYGWGATEILL